MRYKRVFTKNIVLLLVLSMLITLLPVNLFADAGSDMLTAAVDYYRQHKTTLDSWWELVALKGAGQDIHDGKWTLPQWEGGDLAGNVQPTEYAGCILGLLAMGEDPSNALGGRNLLSELAGKQGTNGSFGNGAVNMHIWAMIALDTAGGDYNKSNAVSWLLSQQKSDGGFALTGDYGDNDVTGMALVALSRHREQTGVNTAISSAVSFLREQQLGTGGFSSQGKENSNTIATVISGLVAAGENIFSDSWEKDGTSMLDALKRFQREDGSFLFQLDSTQSNGLATEQSLIALGDIAEGSSVWTRLGASSPVPPGVPVHVRVEGSSETIADTDVSVTSAVYGQTAADALIQVLNDRNISYEIVDSLLGLYLTSINGEEAQASPPYAGWLFLINGKLSSVGIGAYALQSGDDLVFYYGTYPASPSDTLVPEIEIQPAQPKVGEDLTVTVTSSYSHWEGEAEEKVPVKVSGARISFNGETYTTNDEGQVLIPSADTAGTYTLKVSKDNPGSYPGLMRTGITVVYYSPASKTVHVRVEGSSETIADTDVTVSSSGSEQTVLDALKQLLDSMEIPYTAESGGYVSSINGETAGQFHGWDGWLCLVNGELISDVPAEHNINDGDDIIFYYGMYPPDTLIPLVDIQPEQPKVGESVAATVYSAGYYDYTAQQMVDKKEVAGAVVSFNGKTYTTDDEGKVEISSVDVPGTYGLKVSKDNPGSYPSLLRTGSIPVVYSSPDNRVNIGTNGKKLEVSAPTVITVDQGISSTSLQVNTTVTNGQTAATVPYIHADVAVTGGTVAMDIPQNTTITSSAGWDGTIQLPSLLPTSSVTVSNATVNAVIEVGAPGFSLAFDKPVRLVFPGQAGKSLGFIGSSGSLQTIDTVLAQDSMAAALALPDDGAGKIDVGGDLVVWTKHFTKFVVYTPQPPDDSGSGGSGGDTTPSSKTVTLSVTGDSQKGTILSSRTVALQAGDTPYSILVRALGNGRVTKKGSGSSLYVSSIDGLAEFDRGPESGWMYSVNGINPNVSAGTYILSDGDVVRWYYTLTLDGTEDGGTGTQTDGSGRTEAGSGSGSAGTSAKTQKEELKKVLSENMQTTVKKILGQDPLSDWSAFALAQAGQKVPAGYGESLKNYIKEQAGSFRTATDIARVMLAAKAVGLDPEALEGCNLVEKLYNFEKVDKQGVSGPVFALIALDSGKYGIPENARWTRDGLASLILEYQNSDGGFCLSKGEKSGVDLTAMALQALSNYKDRADVKKAVTKAVDWLSRAQLKSGGFKNWDSESSESISQVIIALTSLGVDPGSASFTKTEGDLLSSLLAFKKEDGGFSHLKGANSDEMATEQALMALTAYKRFLEGGKRLYELAGAADLYSDTQAISGWALPYVQKAAQYHLMQGTDAAAKRFEPARKISRAEFAVLLLRLLGEQPMAGYSPVYRDVRQDSWYAGYVLKAREKGLIKGVSDEEFAPDRPVSRQEMAVMAARAFGLQAESENPGIADLDTAGEWARPSITAVYNKNIMTGDNSFFRPEEPVTREMAAVIAVRLYEMKAKK
ncbi:MAG: DUF4430 domain-containing protein [Clostridiales bacterium]|nr:DUF4430 domain-containing protein [Eubacteriales bacterium]MDH7566221.1 DUF4430 domain-containing protein [Clostridiales bacterium]